MSWNPRALPDLTGRTFAVTGGNTGIGYFVAEQLAAAGGRVVILGRDPDRLRAAVEALRRQVPVADISTIPLDLADLDSVASAADALTRLDRLDALIENAGVSAPGRQRLTTRQGLELAVGTNHLGHFVLTALAMPVLLATPGSRVVPVGSTMTRRSGFDLDDLLSERSYAQQRAYVRSKHAVQSRRRRGRDGSGVTRSPGDILVTVSARRTGEADERPGRRQTQPGQRQAGVRRTPRAGRSGPSRFHSLTSRTARVAGSLGAPLRSRHFGVVGSP